MDTSSIKWVNLEGYDSLPTHMQAFASILFCYVNHQLVFPSCRNLQQPTSRRLDRLFLSANGGELLIYMLIGVSGYALLSQHEETSPIGEMVITSIPIWQITVGKMLMVISLYLAIPLNMFPARTVLLEALSARKNNFNHYLWSSVLAASSCTVAIFFQ